MGNSYSTNQWYGLPGGVTGAPTGGLSRTSVDNPEFLYPKKVRKNLGGGPDKVIQRGFIRSLLSEVPGLKEVLPNRRFFFQFNPERIMRSVSVSSGMMMPLLQDAQQFSVATPGNSTFSFDIFLNREAEVNQNTTVTSPANTENISLDFITSNPQQFGVLSDLSVLDTIIGQGVSQDTVEALAKIQAISSTWEASDTTGGSVSAPTTAPTTEAEAAAALGKVFGNSAFLISTPIRIVFSSLFMVDGFITGSAVQFSKFSENLVPTMCAINLTVEAKYIGFARKGTYLTDSLQNMISNPNAGGTPPPPVSVVGSQEEYNFLINILKGLPDYQISLHGIERNDHDKNWSEFKKTYAEVMGYETLLYRCGFVGNVVTPPIYTALQTGKYVISLTHTPSLSIWRPYANEAEKAAALASNRTRSYQPLNAVKTSPLIPGRGGSAPIKDVKILEVTGTPAVITDTASWLRLVRYGGDSSGYGATEDATYDNKENVVLKNAIAQNASFDTGEAKNLYLALPSYNSISDVAKNTYIYVEYSLKIEAKIFSAGSLTKPSTIYFEQKGLKSVQGNSKSGFTFKIDKKLVK